jgi:hypothetical protein
MSFTEKDAKMERLWTAIPRFEKDLVDAYLDDPEDRKHVKYAALSKEAKEYIALYLR